MARCISCGAELPDYYTQCPNCGTPVQQQAQPQNPYGYGQSMGGYVPPAYQQAPITTPLGWFGWSCLVGFLPIIGAIIMYNVVKDPTAKNYAKMLIIWQSIGILICVLFGAILVPAMIGYVNKASRYGLGLINLVPFLK